MWARIAIVVSLTALTSGATATPMAGTLGTAVTAPVQLIHHREWHRGGPPWTRNSRRGRGNYYGWEVRRGWQDRGRSRWRGETRSETWIERPSRSYRSYRYYGD